MASRPAISIVLCTRDRAALLAGALDSLAGLDVAADEVELLLVDNGSLDETPRVARRFARAAPFEVRCLFEPRPGLSAARNTAIAEARGTHLLFTDDDQLVDRALLREHRRVAQAHGSVAQQGGIELLVLDGRPWWLQGELAVMLGRTQDLPEGPAPVDLYGGNMFLRRDLFDDLEGFREDLGKGAAGYSEDLELTRRLEAQGEVVVYAPSARIFHVIGSDRTTPPFFRRNAFDKGWSDGVLRGAPEGLARAAVRTLWDLAADGGQVLQALARADEHRALVAQIHGAHRLGALLGAARGTGRSR